MGSRLVVTWECDRCQVTTEGYEPMFQPTNWWTLRLTGPPKAVPDEAYTERATLCPDCRLALKGWLAAGALVGEHIDGEADG